MCFNTKQETTGSLCSGVALVFILKLSPLSDLDLVVIVDHSRLCPESIKACARAACWSFIWKLDATVSSICCQPSDK